MSILFKRLWVRLSIAFTAVIVMAWFVTGPLNQLIFAPPSIRSAVRDRLDQPGGLISQLAEVYRDQEGWDAAGIAAVFETEAMTHLADVVFVADTQGNVVYGNPEMADASPENFDRNFPIFTDGVLVGYVGFSRPAVGAAQLQEEALRVLSYGLMTTALVGAVIGVIGGVIISRSLSAPLNRLAAAARAIGAGKLDQRVKIEGSQEVTIVAKAFNDMAGALQEAEKLRRNLVADVAHELRTPLSVLQGNLQAILDDVYPLEKTEITRLYDQTRLLSRLVEDLRLLSQADAGLLVLDVQPANMTKLVTDQVEAFRSTASGKEIGLSLEISPALHPVNIDSPRMNQVLHNLLDNALCYTPQGGTIAVRLRPEQNSVRLEVQDSGRGIPPEHLPYLFDRFYRIDGTRSRETGGTGLGLAIARSIVAAHGGEISATSDGIAGHGSTFIVRLPVDSGRAPTES